MNNLKGQTFNRLTVIERVGSGKYGAKWLCKCSCGNETIAYGYLMKIGQVKSCGCLRRKDDVITHDIHFITDDGLLNLQAGIVKQAADDWRVGNKEDKMALEKWFLSEWGQALSDYTGEAIIRNLKKECPTEETESVDVRDDIWEPLNICGGYYDAYKCKKCGHLIIVEDALDLPSYCKKCEGR